jgi:hypothetical protein
MTLWRFSIVFRNQATSSWPSKQSVMRFACAP